MNRKGFTLIELLAVIILIGLVATLIMPTAINSLKESKQKSYEIFIENVKTAAANYYMECENGGTNIDCNKSGNFLTITTSLGSLASNGFLKGTSVKDDKSLLNVLDPRNNNNLNDCQITITKNNTYVTINNITSKKVTYTVSPKSGDNCPSDY